MPLKTRQKLPPGGWIYQQRDGNNKVVKTFKSMSPFKEAAQDILQCREANHFERATFDEVSEDLDAATCERLGFDPRHCSKKNSPEGAFQFTPRKMFQASAQHLREGAEAVRRRSAQVSDGIQILKDWLGEGAQPVPPDIAQSRADICLRCKFNVSGFKPIAAIAEIIRQQVEKKRELKLTVTGEESLNTCDICWCHLPLKVHVPIKYILDNTPEPMLEKFRQEQPACWIVKETQNPAPK